MAQIYARGSKGHHTFYLSVVESGTNIENNTSTVTINFWLVDDNNWYFDTWGSNLTYTVTVNGTTYSGNIPDHDTKTTYIITNQTQTITHNNDGTKQISFSFSTTDTTGAYYTPGTASASGTLDLTTLPRASTVTVNNQTIASASGNVSFSITSKADFYHKYRYTINGTTSDWLTAGRVNTTTASFNIAYSTILSAMHNTNLSTLTVEVQTYNSSAYSTLVGTKSGSGNITVTLKPTAPTLTTLGFRSRSSGVNSNITTPTAGYTTVALTAWSHGTSSGASSYTTYFSVDQNASLQTTSATANNTVIETNTLPANAKQYTLTYTAYTIDSRGNQSVNATKTIVVYGYTAPLLTLTAYRTATNGSSDTTEDGAGLYSYVAFSNTLRGQADTNGALISGNQNAIVSATCKYGSTSVTSGSHIALSEAETRTFTYTVQDRFTTTSTSVTIPQAKFPLDLYDDGAGNVGVGAGTIAKSGQFNFGIPLASSSGSFSEMLCDVTDAEVKLQDSTLTSSSTDDQWLTALLKAICVKYPSKSDVVFKGRLSPNYRGFYEVYIYNTSATQNGIPQYSYGTYRKLPDNLRIFYTNNYSYSGMNPKASTADNATSAVNATNASYANYLNVVSGNEIRFHNRLQSEGTLWFNYKWQEGLYATISRYNFGNGGGGYAAIMASRYYDNGSRKAPMEINLWTGSLTGTNSIDLDISAYKRIRIYAQYATTQQMIWEIDVTKLHATTQYRCNHCELSWLDTAWFHTIFELSVSKARITLNNVYNMNISGTTFAQNNSTAYQIYQIDGIL